MSEFSELDQQQRQQLIDSRQLFVAYREGRRTYERRFCGSMRWLTRRGKDYLHRKRGGSERSVGPRSPETEQQYRSFVEGRAALRERLKAMSQRMDEMAPVNRALNLGRIPKLTARILRRLDDARLLGQHLIMIGTNALFCYESAAGVFLEAGLLATADADLLWDARQRVALLLPEVRRSGIIEILTRVDRSFELAGPKAFRAVNAKGFYVDLIRPEDKNFFDPQARRSLGECADDLEAAPIYGLKWLVNAPKFEVVAIGADGYPLRVVSPDPRAFALHKLWLSKRPDRDPVKRQRDEQQGLAVARLCVRYFNLAFDSEALRALPESLRKLARRLRETSGNDDEGAPPTPAW